MQIETFQMMKGVMPGANYVIVAENDNTKVGIRPIAGPMVIDNVPVIGAGFKLRIEGVPLLIPSYASSAGEHHGSLFVRPFMQMPSMAHWIHEPLKEAMPLLVEALFEELGGKGLKIVANADLVTDYMLEVFLNEYPEPEAKLLDGEPKFINPKHHHVEDHSDDE